MRIKWGARFSFQIETLQFIMDGGKKREMHLSENWRSGTWLSKCTWREEIGVLVADSPGAIGDSYGWNL